mmetsp:Transcript_29518/g.68400  ORF Transcript_29518/g.68400 Transcript_29518/m.68400 type:complete len:461 (+) Transcript_29518:11-1393(+)
MESRTTAAGWGPLRVVEQTSMRALVLCALVHIAAGLSVESVLENLILPNGYNISIFAKVPSARSMTMGDTGVIYVGTNAIFHDRDEACYDCFSGDTVYAVVDPDGDGVAEERFIIADHLYNPNGVTYHNKGLYVAEVSRILVFPDIDDNYRNRPSYQVVNALFPTDLHHGWKFIRFGPDGKLYVPVGGPCNTCERPFPYSGITRINVSHVNSTIEPYVSGVRNSVGFDWHPVTKDLWFTDNGRDNWGNDQPPDELNRVTAAGQNFGFPYCYGQDLVDSEYNTAGNCDGFTPPAQDLGPHVAAIGMRFYTGSMLPLLSAGADQAVVIAEHGSWNRNPPLGYRVTVVRMADSKAASYDILVDGWLNTTSGVPRGRPTDVMVMDDGSVLIADDLAGCIYRLTYTANADGPPTYRSAAAPEGASESPGVSSTGPVVLAVVATVVVAVAVAAVLCLLNPRKRQAV